MFFVKPKMKNINRFLIISFMMFFFPFMVKAQTNYEDVVYLKNGSIIHGMIIEQVPNKSIKIMTKDESIFVCKMDEIEKITKEEIENPSLMFYNKIRKRGYINMTETGFSAGDGFSYGLQTVNGYLFNPMISLGLGTGVDIDKGNNLSFIPLFIDLRAYMLEKRVSPYMCMAAGYSFSTENGTKGGRIVNPSLGVRIYLSPKSAILFSVGYRLQAYTQNWIGYNNQPVIEKESVGYINFKVGFML